MRSRPTARARRALIPNPAPVLTTTSIYRAPRPADKILNHCETFPVPDTIVTITVKNERSAAPQSAGLAARICLEVIPMNEIRGAEAVRYAREWNIFFNIDVEFLAEAEEEMREERTSVADVYGLIKERTGIPYDPVEIVPGKPIFDFLINRYGDGWIYVAREGKNPEAEEGVALRMFRRLLGEEPVSLIDVKGLYGRYSRTRFGNTGFPRHADLNLLFHAAFRLAGKGRLECVEDEKPLPTTEAVSYGGRRFGLPPDVEVSLANVVCDRCRGELGESTVRLHAECARRLRRALGKTTSLQ